MILIPGNICIPIEMAAVKSLLTTLMAMYSYVNLGYPKTGSKQVPLFIFGDSLFDAGNNNYLNLIYNRAQYWPYGHTFFNYPTGRLCDGRTVADFISEFGNLPLLEPYLQPGFHQWTLGTNFASAGSGALVETNPEAINLEMQLAYFKAVEKKLQLILGDVETKSLLKRAVYLFSMGGNDYFSFNTNYPNASESARTEYVGMVIGNITIVLQEIYNMGGRKIGFQNAGPLGCLPLSRALNPSHSGECVEELQDMAELHNFELSQALQKLEEDLPGFKYSIFDYFHSLGDRIDNPSKYGFEEGKAACCGIGPYGAFDCGGAGGTASYELCSNSSEYVWFDNAHTTQALNLQLAQLLWNGNPNVTAPYNMMQLFQLD